MFSISYQLDNYLDFFKNLPDFLILLWTSEEIFQIYIYRRGDIEKTPSAAVDTTARFVLFSDGV